MARYYFNVRTSDWIEDREGADLENEAAAHAYAIEAAREYAAAAVLKGHLCLRHRIEVVDHRRLVVEVVTIGHTVEVEP